MPLVAAFLVLATLTLIADIVILVRWLIYRVRLDEARRLQMAASVPSAEPILEFDLERAETSGEGAAAAMAAESLPAPEPPPLSVPPPFARTWSLVDPFLGFQATLLLTALLIVAPLIVLMVLAEMAAGLRSSGSAGIESFLDSLTPWIIVLSLFVQNGVTIAVVLFFLKRYGVSLSEIGLKRPTARQIFLGLGLGLIVMLLAAGADEALSWTLKRAVSPATLEILKKMAETTSVEGLYSELSSPWQKLLLVFGGVIAAPLGEEIFFRGLLYNSLKHRMNVPAAIVLSGFLFALVHFNPLSVLVIFPMGMLLAYVYERTGSLWITIIMHALNNGVAFALLWYAQRGA